MRNGWIAIATLLLASCIPPGRSDLPRPSPSTARPMPTQSDPVTRQCFADLRDDKVRFAVLPDRRFEGGCSALGSVQLLDIGTPVANLGAMTCPLARAFARWTRESVQPAARVWLGSTVNRIESFGTYSCRSVNGQPGGV